MLPLTKPARLTTLVVACLLIGACSAGTDATSDTTPASAATAGADGTSTATSSEPEPATSSAAGSSSTGSASTSTSSTGGTEATGDGAGDEPEQPFLLALAADGLTIVDSSSGSTTQLLFGTAMANVLTGIESTLGVPATTSPGNAECGNGQATVAQWAGAISVDFGREDELLSWTLLPGSELTDLAGVGLGSSYGDLSAVWDVTVTETTLGHEFSTSADVAGLGGLLSGPGPDATITDLWAGPICAFR